jgi:hypothetical protein
MVWSRGIPLNRIALVSLLPIFLISYTAGASPEQLIPYREKILSLQQQISQIDIREKNLSSKESQLTKKINSLKKDARSNPGLLSNFRIENLLKELRENILIHQEEENRKANLEEQMVRARGELSVEMENEINRLIREAQESFKAGKEDDSNRSFRQALALMEEHRQLQSESVPVSPASPSFAEFVTDGKETPEKLREIADFAIHDLGTLQKEARLLEQNRNRIQGEIALRKNLISYPELLQREDNIAPIQIESIESELIQYEKRGKLLESDSARIQSSIKLLSEKIREIEQTIRQKEEK